VNFSRIRAASDIPKWLEIDQDNRTKFSALNVNFSSPSHNLLRSMRPVHKGVKEGYLFKIGYPLLACQAWKRLQIGTNILRITTSTGDCF